MLPIGQCLCHRYGGWVVYETNDIDLDLDLSKVNSDILAAQMLNICAKLNFMKNGTFTFREIITSAP